MTFDTELKKKLLDVVFGPAVIPGGLKTVFTHPVMKRPGNWICDCLSRLRRMAHSKSLAGPQTAERLYNVFMRYPRSLIALGMKRLFFVFDKGVHADKSETVASRRAKAREQEKTAAKEEDEGKHNPYDDRDTHFVGGLLVTFRMEEPNPADKKDLADRLRVVAITETIVLQSILNNRTLRAEFLDWFVDQIQAESSSWGPTVEAVVDWTFDQARGPCSIINGQKKLAPGGANLWDEADHAIGMWTKACLDNPGWGHTVVWAVDGDLLIVLLWVIYNYRRALKTHELTTQLTTEHPNKGYLSSTSQLQMKTDDKEQTLEPRVVFVWEAQESKKTLVLDINEAVSCLINRRLTPATVALCAMLTANDYVEKKDLLPGVGAVKVFQFLEKSKIVDEDFDLPDFKRRVLNPLTGNKASPVTTATFEKVKRALERWRTCAAGGKGDAPAS